LKLKFKKNIKNVNKRSSAVSVIADRRPTV